MLCHHYFKYTDFLLDFIWNILYLDILEPFPANFDSSTFQAPDRERESLLTVHSKHTIIFSLRLIDSQNSQIIAAEMDMVSALQTRKGFLEKQLIEKRELLNMLCLREAVRIILYFIMKFSNILKILM